MYALPRLVRSVSFVLSSAALAALVSCSNGAGPSSTTAGTSSGSGNGGGGGAGGAGTSSTAASSSTASSTSASTSTTVAASSSSTTTSSTSSSSTSSTSTTSSSSGSGITCPSGEATCGGTQCLLLSTDPKNCGACGHDCQGGSCSGGMCREVTLASASGGGYALSLCADASHLYWTGNLKSAMPNTIQTMPKSGGVPVTIASGYQVGGSAMVTDGTTVFYLAYGYLLSIPASGGTVTTLATPVFNSTNGGALVLSSSVLVWSDDNGVYRANKDGSGLQTLSGAAAKSVAADDTYAYWTRSGSQIGSDMIQRAPIGGGTAANFVQGLNQPRGLGLFQTTLYFNSDLYVFAQSTAGATSTFATVQTNGLYLGAVDASGIYVAGLVSGGGELARVPLAGGALTEIGGGVYAPVSIVTDATSIYWIQDGSIMMLAK